MAPTQCPWGQKALRGYLGEDPEARAEYDACSLIKAGSRLPNLLADQGIADGFLTEQLRTELLITACEMLPGYDHSYYFISTFMAEHVRWHAAKLLPAA